MGNTKLWLKKFLFFFISALMKLKKIKNFINHNYLFFTFSAYRRFFEFQKLSFSVQSIIYIGIHRVQRTYSHMSVIHT